MTKINIKNLSYQYSLAHNKALNDISLKIDAGDFIGIIGANKAGKTTLAKSLAGLVPHFYKGDFSGDIVIDNLNTKEESISEISLKVGLVFQDPFNQISGAKLTVYDEVAFGLENIGLEREKMIGRIDYYLDLMGITAQKNSNPFELSGGQMQRLAIASIMAREPEIFVLDEPSSQLDPQGTEEVFEAVDKLREKNLTVIMVSQKVEKMAKYANKILLLNEGSLIDFDKTEKIFSREDLKDYGVRAPVYTEIAKELKLKKENGNYPITKEELKELVVRKYGQNFSK